MREREKYFSFVQWYGIRKEAVIDSKLSISRVEERQGYLLALQSYQRLLKGSNQIMKHPMEQSTWPVFTQHYLSWMGPQVHGWQMPVKGNTMQRKD